MAITSSATGATGTRDEGRHLGVALLVIATAQLMVVLDATVVNVALPRIQDALGFSGSGLEWVVNAYALVLGGLLLPVRPGGTARAGRFDLAGAVTGTGGVAALVYGLSNAATSPDGTSHWGGASVLAALTAGVVLLAAFAVIEVRSHHALMPARLLRSRDRAGALLMMLAVGTIVSGVFFFVTLFAQDIWGYSPLRTGLAFLPLTVTLLAGTAAATRLVPRIGARPLLAAGAVTTAGGLYWLSRMTEHGTYAGGLLGPGLITGAGLGLLFLLFLLSGRPGGRAGGHRASHLPLPHHGHRACPVPARYQPGSQPPRWNIVVGRTTTMLHRGGQGPGPRGAGT